MRIKKPRFKIARCCAGLLVLSALSDYGGGGSSTPAPTYTVGGTVAGLLSSASLHRPRS